MDSNNSITLRQDALNHISGSDIIIRSNQTFRLVFRPELIPLHPRNPDAKVGGIFICQRKRQNGAWEDYNELPLTHLRDSEWVKLDISSEELFDFLKKLLPLYGLSESRIMSGRYTRVSTQELPQLQMVLDFIRSGNNIGDVLGAINQLLVAKISLQENYKNLFPNKTRVISPKCLLLTGKIQGLTVIKKKNLDMFRNTLKEIEIVTYDELKSKIDGMLSLITGAN